jgi:hypothetical protein
MTRVKTGKRTDKSGTAIFCELHMSRRDISDLINYCNDLNLSLNALVRKLLQKELLDKSFIISEQLWIKTFQSIR